MENAPLNCCRHGAVNSLVNCQIKDHVDLLRKCHSRNVLQSVVKLRNLLELILWNFLAMCFSWMAKPNTSVPTASDSPYHISTYSVSCCLEIDNVCIMTSVYCSDIQFHLSSLLINANIPIFGLRFNTLSMQGCHYSFGVG